MDSRCPFNHPPSYLLRQGLSLNLELSYSGRLAGQHAPGMKELDMDDHT